MNPFQNSYKQAMSGSLGQQSAMNQGQQGLLSSGALSAQQYNSLLWQTHMNKETKAHWMIDGRAMTFEQWLDEIAPDDSPQRTFLILKYKK
jgi:hypothetical protein